MRPTLARRRSARNRSLCSGTFRRNNSEMLQIEIGRCHSLQPVKEASTGRVDRTVSSPLGYTEHLIRQYQLGNISYYCGGAERCFGSSSQQDVHVCCDRSKINSSLRRCGNKNI